MTPTCSCRLPLRHHHFRSPLDWWADSEIGDNWKLRECCLTVTWIDGYPFMNLTSSCRPRLRDHHCWVTHVLSHTLMAVFLYCPIFHPTACPGMHQIISRPILDAGLPSTLRSTIMTAVVRRITPLYIPASFPPKQAVNPKLPKPTGSHTRSDSETRRRFIAAQTANRLQVVTNNYYIRGGVGGAGGIGRDQGIGGGGGAGHGPTLNFYTPPREEQSEFRTIQPGDIILKEIRLKSPYGVVEFQNRSSPGAVVWRVHSGEICGGPGAVTVAMYEGDRAEEEWRQDVAKYAAIRHPYIMQLYGVVSTRTLRAMVFHDGADQQWDDVGVD
ncbi:hypothetical protein MSAN_00815100 [Mycena sanguinolenta]|uniref:Protein kinase domain-containing protein n=1 Tax=Mycena sanguinolenta TaxID=230812 RepID=A0A8H6Z099_9AGAR|nr:hypothetical protein MSAN_00815100 [Mycena sanguinolenta]